MTKLRTSVKEMKPFFSVAASAIDDILYHIFLQILHVLSAMDFIFPVSGGGGGELLNAGVWLWWC